MKQAADDPVATVGSEGVGQVCYSQSNVSPGPAKTIWVGPTFLEVVRVEKMFVPVLAAVGAIALYPVVQAAAAVGASLHFVEKIVVLFDLGAREEGKCIDH